MEKSTFEMLKTANLVAEEILKVAPDEGDCTDEENEALAELANFVNAFKAVAKKEGEKEENVYYVTYKIDARYVTEVRSVKDIEKIIDAADANYIDCNIGDFSDIDGEPIIIEDKDGNFIWEK